jgi:hypothetical protein
MSYKPGSERVDGKVMEIWQQQMGRMGPQTIKLKSVE